MDQQIEAKSLDNEGVFDGQEKREEILDSHIIPPCAGMMFSSEKEVYEYYKAYARQSGFGVCKKSKKNDDDGHQRYYSLACNKSGSGKITLNAKGSAKTSCKAKINIRVSIEGSFIISRVCLDHNHALVPKMRYREYSEEKMRYYKLCSKLHKLAEIGADSQDNFDFLLKWIDEVLAKLGSKVDRGNQHVSSTILLSLEEHAEGHPPIKRKQSMVENAVEKKKRNKKEVLQEQHNEQSQDLQPLNMIEEPPSVAADQRVKTGQHIEAKPLDVEGVIDGQEKVEESLNSHSNTPCIGMIFSSEIEVHEFYKSYARRIGFGICKKSEKKGDDGQQKYYSLACHKVGNRIINGKTPSRAKSSIKTGCKAKINIRVSDEGSFIISRVCSDHNHELSPNMRCGEYDGKEDEMMVEKKKSSKKQVIVEEQQHEQSLDMQQSENIERGETSTKTTVAEPAQLDLHTMASQINYLHTQFNSLMELMKARLPPPSQAAPLAFPLTQVWPNHPHPQPGHGRPASYSQPAPFYLNFETNQE